VERPWLVTPLVWTAYERNPLWYVIRSGIKTAEKVRRFHNRVHGKPRLRGPAQRRWTLRREAL